MVTQGNTGMDISKDTSLCHSCAEEITDEYVTCQGYCNAVFHLHCCGTPAIVIKEIVTHRQVFWMCRSCTGLMLDMRHRRSVQCAYEAGQELSLNAHNRIVDQLRSEILTELKSELSANFAKLIASSSLTPKPIPRIPKGKGNGSGRQLFGKKPEPVPENPANPSLQATGKPVSPTFGSLVAPTGPRFWLYLSRLSRRVTVEQVMQLATSRLGVADIEVVRLVAKGQDVSRMNFISFKIGVGENLKAKALSTTTWPEGLVFREFEDRSRGNFWEPPPAKDPNDVMAAAAATANVTHQPFSTPTGPAQASLMDLPLTPSNPMAGSSVPLEIQ